jgi:uncharacterized protein YbcV (DUF1398 family)
MDANLRSIARTCLDAAYDGSLAFPQIVGTLMASGFEGYAVDYRTHTTTYYPEGGDPVVLENPASDGAIAAAFDAEGVATQVLWAQADPPDYSYAAFCRNVKACGCAGYIVSFPGRRVLYFGKTAETHVEMFPQ